MTTLLLDHALEATQDALHATDEHPAAEAPELENLPRIVQVGGACVCEHGLYANGVAGVVIRGRNEIAMCTQVNEEGSCALWKGSCCGMDDKHGLSISALTSDGLKKEFGDDLIDDLDSWADRDEYGIRLLAAVVEERFKRIMNGSGKGFKLGVVHSKKVKALKKGSRLKSKVLQKAVPEAPHEVVFEIRSTGSRVRDVMLEKMQNEVFQGWDYLGSSRDGVAVYFKTPIRHSSTTRVI
ncbi:hypothetical protein HOG48_05755 [Candidatus Peregrinibacteria bacterium]|jgi:hypothetical protein|nr:hypothetical protein [Candidatus Peregrinibacteria bacterium]